MLYPSQRIYFKKNKKFDSFMNKSPNSSSKSNPTELISNALQSYSTNLPDSKIESNLIDFNTKSKVDSSQEQDLLGLTHVMDKEENKLVIYKRPYYLSTKPMKSVGFYESYGFKEVNDSSNLEYKNPIDYFNLIYEKLSNIIMEIFIKDHDFSKEKVNIFDESKESKSFETTLMILSYYNQFEIFSMSGYSGIKIIIVKIIQELNYFVTKNWKNTKVDNYSSPSNLIFKTFKQYVYHFRKLFITINESYSKFENYKKNKFLDFLVDLIQYYQDLNYIYERLHIESRLLKNLNNDIYLESLQRALLKNIQKSIRFVPIAGNSKMKSFFISKDCITNYQFLEFVNSGEYIKSKYWSIDGIYWKTYEKIKCPLYWKFSNGKWLIKNTPIENVYSHPIQNICYYEAEAFANFVDGRLPLESEWEYVASNRNKTLNPWGYSIPDSVSSDLSNLVESHKGSESLMGINNLYGNVWEYTSSIRKINKSEIEICLKGGDTLTPKFILNNKLKLYLPKWCQHYQTGFRVLKESN